MNIKVCLFLLFVFLILMLLFYYLNLESNIVILLGVVIVLLLNDLIINKDHFTSDSDINSSNIDPLLKEVDETLNKLSKLNTINQSMSENKDAPFIIVESSCSPDYVGVSEDIQDRTNTLNNIGSDTNSPNIGPDQNFPFDLVN
jgi:hypothetical protein